jgi:hypothetical protein
MSVREERRAQEKRARGKENKRTRTWTLAEAEEDNVVVP